MFTYISSSGQVHHYEKAKYWPLTSWKISQRGPYSSWSSCIIWLVKCIKSWQFNLIRVISTKKLTLRGKYIVEYHAARAHITQLLFAQQRRLLTAVREHCCLSSVRRHYYSVHPSSNLVRTAIRLGQKYKKLYRTVFMFTDIGLYFFYMDQMQVAK